MYFTYWILYVSQYMSPPAGLEIEHHKNSNNFSEPFSLSYCIMPRADCLRAVQCYALCFFLVVRQRTASKHIPNFSIVILCISFYQHTNSSVTFYKYVHSVDPSIAPFQIAVLLILILTVPLVIPLLIPYVIYQLNHFIAN